MTFLIVIWYTHHSLHQLGAYYLNPQWKKLLYEANIALLLFTDSFT